MVCSKKVNNRMCHVMNDQFKILVIEVRKSRKGFTCANILIILQEQMLYAHRHSHKRAPVVVSFSITFNIVIMVWLSHM